MNMVVLVIKLHAGLQLPKVIRPLMFGVFFLVIEYKSLWIDVAHCALNRTERRVE